MTAESVAQFVIVATACALAWGFWRAAQARPTFTIRVADGAPEAVMGVVTPAFLQRIREVATAQGIARGVVRGYAHGSLIRLHFSTEFSEPSRQQLRNWWATFGWAAPNSRRTQRCS
jgi:hypothetical protein